MAPPTPHPEDIRDVRLANGIRLVTERMPEARSVTAGVWVGVGGRDESAELAGASHFLEHLLFKGTSTRTARQLAEAIDAVGGEMNAFTSREHTAYYTRLPAPRADLGVEILGDVLTDPAFRPHEVEAERQVILEELLMNLDVPEDHVHTLLAEALFPGHPLGREVLGTRETVERVTRDEIAAFFTGWYRPRNLVVAAAGHLDHDRMREAFESSLGGLEGGERPVR
ncbi:MAG TPA: pitrilysin family protein, partial [Acidimicrobiales bacterium]